MSDEPEHIDREELLVGYLAAGHSKMHAGRLVGMSPATVRRRLADDDFKRRVQERRRELLEETSSGLATGAREAVACLRSLLTGETETTRLGAAKSLLELAIKYRGEIGLESRIAELESRFEGASDAKR